MRGTNLISIFASTCLLREVKNYYKGCARPWPQGHFAWQLITAETLPRSGCKATSHWAVGQVPDLPGGSRDSPGGSAWPPFSPSPFSPCFFPGCVPCPALFCRFPRHPIANNTSSPAVHPQSRRSCSGGTRVHGGLLLTYGREGGTRSLLLTHGGEGHAAWPLPVGGRNTQPGPRPWKGETQAG